MNKVGGNLGVSKIVGASVILLDTAIGSGELIIWPYITTTVGVGLLWLAAFGFATQYFLNMEIERYERTLRGRLPVLDCCPLRASLPQDSESEEPDHRNAMFLKRSGTWMAARAR